VILTDAAMTDPRAFRPAAPHHRVLIVDDEERIRQVLVRILRGRGITADAASDGTEAVARTVSGSYDLVILDLLMPGQDGFSALRAITRQRPDQAVLVLSCLTDPQSKMASLGLGADDYVPKPFHVGELVARVQARLRAAARPGQPVLSSGPLTLDVLHRHADTGNGPVPLTSRECQLLWELMHPPGAVVSKDDLLARVWGGAPDSGSNVVDVYIRRLRSRLGPDVITTVRGEGYCVGPG
jgi:two-component system, OmpR family, copper resistance phosphate regulon response regulator CusR